MSAALHDAAEFAAEVLRAIQSIDRMSGIDDPDVRDALDAIDDALAGLPAAVKPNALGLVPGALVTITAGALAGEQARFRAVANAHSVYLAHRGRRKLVPVGALQREVL